MVPQRRAEPPRHGHVAQPPALRAGHLPLPVGPLDADLALHEVQVLALERHHLAGPKPRFPAEQDSEVGAHIDPPCGLNKSLVLVEVVQPRLW